MRPFLSLVRTALMLIAFFATASCFTPSASAQQKEGDVPPSARNWPAGYGLAVMGIVLGLLIVLRPGTRGGEEAK